MKSQTLLMIAIALLLLITGCNSPGEDTSSTPGTNNSSTTTNFSKITSLTDNTTTTVPTMEDGTPNTLPPDVVTEPDPETVTADEKAAELQAFHDAIAALANNKAVDKLEIRCDTPNPTPIIHTTTDTSLIRRWISFLQDMKLTAEAKAYPWNSVNYTLTFYENGTVCYSLGYCPYNFYSDNKRVMLKMTDREAGDGEVLSQLFKDIGFM